MMVGSITGENGIMPATSGCSASIAASSATTRSYTRSGATSSPETSTASTSAAALARGVVLISRAVAWGTYSAQASVAATPPAPAPALGSCVLPPEPPAPWTLVLPPQPQAASEIPIQTSALILPSVAAPKVSVHSHWMG